ncbi:MAG: metallophosphoesterase, partial [Alphaproteobacteria bacterium]
ANPISHNTLVYIGDYVDRGYESRAVIDHLLAPTLPGFERVTLKGNHEEFILQFLEGGDVADMWLVNGGRETLMSYGVMMPPGIEREEQVEAARQKFREAFPPTHKEFLESLALTHNVGGYLFVHAGIRPGVALDAQEPADLLWIREAFLNSTAAHGAVIVHGHTPVGEPEVQSNRIGIDTGAFATGHLTCVVLEGTSQSFLAT